MGSNGLLLNGELAGSGGVAGGVRTKDLHRRLDGLGVAKTGAERLLPEQARNARKSPQMFRTRIFRGQQHEDQIDRALVDGVEVGRINETGEAARDAGQSWNAGMGDGDALAHSGGAQAFTLEHPIENSAGIKAERVREHLRQARQNLSFALPSGARKNRSREKNV